MAKSKVFKNCLALLLITLVAGFALAVVMRLRQSLFPRRRTRQKWQRMKAYFRV